MKLFYKLLKQDPNTREGITITTSALGIVVNTVLAIVKILIGVAVGSIAIISEGANNASDSATSLITIIGTKLSSRHPTKKHPFGFGRIEYLTSLVISILILVTAIELFISSFRIIFTPKALSISYITLVIIAVSAIIKFLLGTYSIRMGKRVGSNSLIAVGTDCRNDAFISAVTILSALIFLLFDFSLDAYAGILTSIFILKTGLDILKETISNLLGKPATEDLALTIYEEIKSVPCILGAADLILHNYGPDSYAGSMNLEIDHEMTIGEAYEAVHALQLQIKQKYGIVMVFGMYAVDSDHENVKIMREHIEKFIASYEHIKSFHALYLAPSTNEIYCDFVVDYALRDWDKLKVEFTKYMKKLYPEYQLTVTIELNYV